MKINFTPEQLSILDKAIQQLPYYMAAPLIQHINLEIENQINVQNVGGATSASSVESTEDKS